MDELANILGLVGEEVERSHRVHPYYSATAHDAWAILHEEADELWEAVRLKQGPMRDAQMRKEAIQVAAMAVRFLLHQPRFEN